MSKYKHGICSALAFLMLTLTTSVDAALEMELRAVDGDVVLMASGTLDLSSTTNLAPDSTTAQSAIDAAGAFAPSVVAGSHTAIQVRIECGDVAGPLTIGQGTETWKGDSGTGGIVGIYGGGETYGAAGDGLCIMVPKDYVSGAEISASSRFINSSLSSLGVIAGTYRWTWGTGANADSLTLYIGGRPSPISVPSLPISMLIFLVGGLGLFGAVRASRYRLS